MYMTRTSGLPALRSRRRGCRPPACGCHEPVKSASAITTTERVAVTVPARAHKHQFVGHGRGEDAGNRGDVKRGVSSDGAEASRCTTEYITNKLPAQLRTCTRRRLIWLCQTHTKECPTRAYSSWTTAKQLLCSRLCLYQALCATLCGDLHTGAHGRRAACDLKRTGRPRSPHRASRRHAVKTSTRGKTDAYNNVT